MNSLPFQSVSEINKFQDKSLCDLLSYLQQHSAFYNQLFNTNNVDISKIKTVANLKSIPVTTKEDLQNHNMDFLCVDKSEIIEYCTTSGTLGNPVTIALTENDLKRLELNERLSFELIETSSNDIIHLMLSLDRQFMAGIAYYYGARSIGAGIIRGGPGNVAMQIDTIQRLKPTILVAVPSFILNLIAFAFENNIDLNKTSIQKILCIGENIRDENFNLNALSERISKNWSVQLFSTYASTEQQTAFTECNHGNGGHHQPELLIFEILDEENNVLPAGEPGELTITTLGVTGMPLLRYKTGDICSYYNEPCKCGRNTARISPVKGRKKQLIKYKGTTLYPQTIFNALNGIEFIFDYVVRVFKNDMGIDDIEILLSIDENQTGADAIIRQNLQSKLRIVPWIKYVPISNIQKMQLQEGKRKVSRIVDER